MDGELTESHETDVDCGGQYCMPCSTEMVSSPENTVAM